ncbi:MAG: peptidoglycan-associated lipoprotein Pal [Sphingopyxis sp.]|jgi:peptidoglycan-associated lipoprotein|nr:peptidoglycan-associated lipoprotein Pal [Sphingopyxis sp.]
MRTHHIIALTALSAIALTGCARNRTPTELPPATDDYGSGQNGSGSGGIGGAVVPGSQQDFIANISSDTVYFDTDRFNVDEQDRSVLASQAQWLARYPNVRVTVEGHADERGTRDYNLALGERRANAARNYLVSLGVDASRITVVSYGKERPIALGSDEASWAQNRRAVTVTVRN